MAYYLTLIPLLFQHTAARRRLTGWTVKRNRVITVSTHSRPKAADQPFQGFGFMTRFNTQSPEGGCND